MKWIVMIVIAMLPFSSRARESPGDEKCLKTDREHFPYSRFFEPKTIPYSAGAVPHDKPSRGYEDVSFLTCDNVRLHGWVFPHQKEPYKGTVIQFHGSAANIGLHYQLLVGIVDEGYDLFTFDYRGYGQSQGRPSRAGLINDGVAALDFVRAKLSNDHSSTVRNVIVFGQSLGGNIALSSLARFKGQSLVRSVVLEGTFLSYRMAARDVLRRKRYLKALFWAPYVPVPGLFVRNGLFNPRKILHLLDPEIEILVIYHRSDPYLSSRHAENILKQSANSPCAWIFNDNGHITPFFSGFDYQAQDTYRREQLLHFFDDLVCPR